MITAICVVGMSQISAATDTILVNGRVFTGVAGKWTEAVAISQGKVEAVGSSASIRQRATRGATVIDLGGRLVVPGLNDPHVHFGPLNGERVNLIASGDASSFAKPLESATNAAPTCENVLHKIDEAARSDPQGKPLLVRIDGRAFLDPRCTTAALDGIAPRRPVLLRTFTSHAAILNAAAAALLKVDPADLPVAGGFFGKDMKSKRWDGVVHEYENFRLTERLVVYDEQDLKDFLAQAAQFGITSLQIMAWNPERLVQLLNVVKPEIRVRVVPFPIPTGRSAPKPVRVLVPGRIADRVAVEGLKLAVDGSFIERSTAMRDPYPDDPGNRGALNFSGPNCAQFSGKRCAATCNWCSTSAGTERSTPL